MPIHIGQAVVTACVTIRQPRVGEFEQMQDMRTLRLAEAKRLLADGNRTVLDVALTCGFGSVEHFHRTFRAHHGASPDAWRQAMTEEGTSA